MPPLVNTLLVHKRAKPLCTILRYDYSGAPLACIPRISSITRTGSQIAGITEVAAKIRLRFRNINGKPVTCTRLLKMQQRQKKLELKTLDSTLDSFDERGHVCCVVVVVVVPLRKFAHLACRPTLTRTDCLTLSMAIFVVVES
jgi:hypothetical protein